MDMNTRNLRTHWMFDQEMDKQRYPAQKLKFLQDQRFSFGSQMEGLGRTTLREETRVSGAEHFKKKSHSFDLGFFWSWKRESVPLAEKYQNKSKMKLVRRGRSLEGVIPEEDIVIDSSQSRKKLQPQRRSLDLFELPSAIKKFGRSLRAKR